MEAILYQALVGLSSAMYLWLVAAGLTIAFGVLRILNFAHGSLYMMGAYAAFAFYQQLGWGFWAALGLASLTIAVAGLAMERLFFRPMYALDEAYQLILTFGFVLVFADLARLGWGGVFVIPPVPPELGGSVRFLGRGFAVYNLFVIGVGLAVALGLWLLLERTWWGRMVRATASDPEMAGALGIDTGRVFAVVFALAAALAGLGGALSTPLRVVTPGLGTDVIVQAFVITVIGGLGSLGGAFAGALIVGMANALGILFFPAVELFLIYLIMALVLIFRPRGLFRSA